MQMVKKTKNNESAFLEDSYKKSKQDLSLKKYQQIKAALKELCYGCQPDSPFLSIRKICKVIESGPVPVQRAVTELIAEDILYAKSGIGLFIKNPPRKTVAKFSGHHTLRKVKELNFLYSETSDIVKNILLKVVNKVRNRDPRLVDVKLFFDPNATVKPDIAVNFDSANSFLDVSDFAWYDIQRGKLSVEGKHAVTLAYSNSYLFYNEKMLNELEIEKPSYTNFSEQEEYIRKAKSCLEHNGLLGPTSWSTPGSLFGKEILNVLNFLKGKENIDSQLGKKIFNLISKVMDYYCLFAYEGNFLKKSAFGAFLNLETPLFTGHTHCLNQLAQLKDSNLDWKVYPIFNCDNTLPLIPIYATVDITTQLPMECILYMTYLQKEYSQEVFNKHGYITVQRTGKYLPKSPVFEKAAKESWGGYLEESVDNYLFEHILDFHLINCVTEKENLREAFENIFYYSRGYMRNCASKDI